MVAILEDAIMFKSALLNNKIFLKERKPAKMGKTFKIFCAELKEQQLLDTPKTLINYVYLYILEKKFVKN